MSKPDLELLISRATATHAVLVGGAIALGVGGGNISMPKAGRGRTGLDVHHWYAPTILWDAETSG
jgi:hypothetical protein